MTDNDQYLTAREVATWLRVSLRTVQRMTASGDIPHVKMGRQARYPRTGLASITRGPNDAH